MKKLQFNTGAQKGLTLLETMVIVLIMGVIVVASLSKMSHRHDNRTVQKTVEQIQAIGEATLAYYSQVSNTQQIGHGEFPQHLTDLTPVYLPKTIEGHNTLKNPWGGSYSIGGSSPSSAEVLLYTTVPTQYAKAIISKLPRSSYQNNGSTSTIAMELDAPQQNQYTDPSRIQLSEVHNLKGDGTWTINQPSCAPGYGPQIVYGLNSFQNSSMDGSGDEHMLGSGAVTCSTNNSTNQYTLGLSTNAITSTSGSSLNNTNGKSSSNTFSGSQYYSSNMQYISACPGGGKSGDCNDTSKNINVWEFKTNAFDLPELSNARVNIGSTEINTANSQATQYASYNKDNWVFAITRCVKETLPSGKPNPQYVPDPCDEDNTAGGNGGDHSKY